MKKFTTQQKQHLFTAKGELKAKWANLIRDYFTSQKIYPSYWTGSGRRKNLNCKSYEAQFLLRLLGYKFDLGNDAPRGGVEGNYIKISKAALSGVKSLIK